MSRDPRGPRDPGDHAVGVASIDRFCPSQDAGSAAQRHVRRVRPRVPEHRVSDGHARRLVALADQVEHPVAAERLGVVLDAYRRGSEARRALMPSRYASAPWWAVRVWATWRNRISSSCRSRPWCGSRLGGSWAAVRTPRVGDEESVDVGVAEETADSVRHRDHGGVSQPGLPEVADVGLDVGTLDPTGGSRPLVSHQENQRCSWKEYRAWVRPEYRTGQAHPPPARRGIRTD